MLWEGDDGGYNYRDKANDEYRRQRNDVQTCQSGNANYCSYATLHPVETALFIGTTLVGGATVESFILGGGAVGAYDALLWKASSLCISNPIYRILIGEVGELSNTDKSVSDDAFVRYDPIKFDSSIDEVGLLTEFSSDGRLWMTKFKYVKDIMNPIDLETILYRKIFGQNPI